MTKPFMRIDSRGGYIGRLAWWNTFDTQDVAPSWPFNWRIWGKAPILLKGWGTAK